MTRRALISVAAALAAGLGLGWVSAMPIHTAPEAETAAALAQFSPLHGGAAAGAARDRLAALGYGVTADAAQETAPPPPPDIAVLFRRDLTAIEHTPTGPIVWIIDASQAAGRRALRPRAIYQDGWRLSAVRGQVIELRRGAEVRHIDVFNMPQENEH